MKRCGNFKIYTISPIKLNITPICGWALDSVPLIVEEGYLFIELKNKQTFINVKR